MSTHTPQGFLPRRSSTALLHRAACIAAGSLASLFLGAAAPAFATQLDIPGPAGSATFGEAVEVLPNGNIVVIDHRALSGERGAVHLYSPEGALISTLTGSQPQDWVGRGGITVLENGHFVIRSPDWNNGQVTDAGAVTWVNGQSGLSGPVSSTNSLVGVRVLDRVGSHGVVALRNGNYVAVSSFWGASETAPSAGAVTLASGQTGLVGGVTSVNSLTGTIALSQVGSGGVVELVQGNYVVLSPEWSTPFQGQRKGAATWVNGTTGLAANVSAANSLVGSTHEDFMGSKVVPLDNGHFVLHTPRWDIPSTSIFDAGAATWGNGVSGTSGPLSSSVSLVGNIHADGQWSTVTALPNGNYVVANPRWDAPQFSDAGAVTWCSGSVGRVGPVTGANSLVGDFFADEVGGGGVVALTNGHYVVASPEWRNGGAVTWASGTLGAVGVVSPGNSLVGSVPGDRVGLVTALANGNYVVASGSWDNGALQDVGAATWCSGVTGRTGTVSAANSLIGANAGDQVGSNASTALTNGHYVVTSPLWGTESLPRRGAVTWVNGATGVVGSVSEANSLVGRAQDDSIGIYEGVVALSNGNYVVTSQTWDSPTIPADDVGAATWGEGRTGTRGIVDGTNSLTGSTAGDTVGDLFRAVPTPDGSLVMPISQYDHNGIVNSGAVAVAPGDLATTGPLSARYTVFGRTENGGSGLSFAYDPGRRLLVVGQPGSNLLSLLRVPLEGVFGNSFE